MKMNMSSFTWVFWNGLIFFVEISFHSSSGPRNIKSWVTGLCYCISWKLRYYYCNKRYVERQCWVSLYQWCHWGHVISGEVLAVSVMHIWISPTIVNDSIFNPVIMLKLTCTSSYFYMNNRWNDYIMWKSLLIVTNRQRIITRLEFPSALLCLIWPYCSNQHGFQQLHETLFSKKFLMWSEIIINLQYLSSIKWQRHKLSAEWALSSCRVRYFLPDLEKSKTELKEEKRFHLLLWYCNFVASFFFSFFWGILKMYNFDPSSWFFWRAWYHSILTHSWPMASASLPNLFILERKSLEMRRYYLILHWNVKYKFQNNLNLLLNRDWRLYNFKLYMWIGLKWSCLPSQVLKH